LVRQVVGEQVHDAFLADFEDVRRERLADAVTGALLGVDHDPHLDAAFISTFSTWVVLTT
jgi:hypothetical protein